MAEGKGNGRVTNAIIATKLDQLIGMMTEMKAEAAGCRRDITQLQIEMPQKASAQAVSDLNGKVNAITSVHGLITTCLGILAYLGLRK